VHAEKSTIARLTQQLKAASDEIEQWKDLVERYEQELEQARQEIAELRELAFAPESKVVELTQEIAELVEDGNCMSNNLLDDMNYAAFEAAEVWEQHRKHREGQGNAD
jgi:N-acetylglucosamine kinase-like BadF-type ATPase